MRIGTGYDVHALAEGWKLMATDGSSKAFRLVVPVR